jgi:hypothetical protein
MSLIKKPHELSMMVNARVLIYGQPGIGKTTIGLSAPAPIVLDCDRGLHRIAAEHLKDAVQVSKWEDCLQFLNEDLTPYKTIVVDTAGKMIELITQFLIRTEPRLKKNDGTLSLQGYGVRKMVFSNFINAVTAMGKSIIFVAHEREEKDGDVRYVRPEIGGSSGNDLMKDLDLVGYIESYNNKRTISFNATDKFYGKNTANLPDRMEIPNYKGKPADFMAKILGLYSEAVNTKVSMAANYNALLDIIDNLVEGIHNAETANETTAKIKDLEHIWDSKLQGAAKIAKKAAQIGLKMDSGKKYMDTIQSARPELNNLEGNQAIFQPGQPATEGQLFSE